MSIECYRSEIQISPDKCSIKRNQGQGISLAVCAHAPPQSTWLQYPADDSWILTVQIPESNSNGSGIPCHPLET